MIKQADFDKDLIKFGAHQLVHIYCAEIARLQAELKEVQQDKVRLDWLLTHLVLTHSEYVPTSDGEPHFKTHIFKTRSAIDAAMKGATQ